MKLPSFLAVLVVAMILHSCTDDSTNPTNLEPTNYPTEFKVVENTDSSITLSWKDAVEGTAPSHYYIMGVESLTTIIPPQDGTTSALGIVNATVKQGIQSITLKDIEPDKNYTFAIYPFFGEGSAINYKTNGITPTVSVATPSYSGWMPLQVGNRWEYSLTYYDTSSTGHGSTRDGVVYTLSIEKDTLINGVKWYKSIYKSGTGSKNEVGYLTNKGNELWIMGKVMDFGSENDYTPWLLFKAAPAGTTYSNLTVLTAYHPCYTYDIGRVVYSFCGTSGISRRQVSWSAANGIRTGIILKLEKMVLK